ncbi:MAG: stage III sporulation protein AE [Peptococcia bacterium]
MRYKIVLLILLFLLPAASVGAVSTESPTATTPQEIADVQKGVLDLTRLEIFLDEVDKDLGEYLPELSLETMINSLKQGKLDLATKDILSGLKRYFFHEVTLNFSLLGKLLIIAVICAVLQNMQAAFEKGTVAKLAYFVCYLAIITLAINSFHVAVAAGLSAINKMTGFMQLLLPILLVVLTAMGNLTSVALFQPFLMAFLSFLGFLTKTIIFPLIYLTVVLSIVNHISENFKVTKLTGLVKQFTKVGLGLTLTLFIGVITVEGVAGGVVDGVSLRTAKFVTGAFVPVAGSMFADALDAVIGGSILLKNVLGITGVIILALLVLFPVIKILVIALIYRVAAALIQLLGDSMLAETLDDLAGSLLLSFAAVLTVGIMFFLAITALVATANFTLMLR